MQASLCDSSAVQYNSGLKKWWAFCFKEAINPYRPSTESVLQFLTEEFHKGSSYSTLNSIRSAISLTVGSRIGSDEDIKRFFKGVSNLRPPTAKYQSTWDPKLVLDYYTNNKENSELSLKELSFKLITLIALVTAHRMQTFALIELKNLEISEKKILIKITKRIKTSGINKPQPLLEIPFFKENTKICAATTLSAYLDRTINLRHSDCENLFISLKKPYKAVSSQTLSKWVSKVLQLAGVNTNIFTAYSTRHASTSNAKRFGIPLDTIRKAAGWTKESQTFARFYDKPVLETQQFANSLYRK